MHSKYTNLMLSSLFCFGVVLHANATAMQTDDRCETLGNSPLHTQQLFCLILQSSQTEENDYKPSEVYMQMQSFFDKMKSKKIAEKKNLNALRKLYQYTSRQFIHEYQNFTFLPQMLEGKSYDCVSSALLYSFLLEEMGFDYSIFVTKTHTYLKVHLENQDVLLETTDPVYGLITNPKAIKKQISAYKKESVESSIAIKDKNLDAGKKINLKELVGVHFYNMFLYHYQNREFDQAAKAFNKASLLYKASPEIKMFSKYFAKS